MGGLSGGSVSVRCERAGEAAVAGSRRGGGLLERVKVILHALDSDILAVFNALSLEDL